MFKQCYHHPCAQVWHGWPHRTPLHHCCQLWPRGWTLATWRPCSPQGQQQQDASAVPGRGSEPTHLALQEGVSVPKFISLEIFKIKYLPARYGQLSPVLVWSTLPVLQQADPLLSVIQVHHHHLVLAFVQYKLWKPLFKVTIFASKSDLPVAEIYQL